MKRIVFLEKGIASVSQYSMEPPSKNEFTVENVYSLVSAGTELAQLNNRAQKLTSVGSQFPRFPGYCSIGRVSFVGSDVESVSAGDVIFHLSPHAESSTLEINGRVHWCKVPDNNLFPEILLARFYQIALTIVYVLRGIPSDCIVSGGGALGICAAKVLQNLGCDHVALVSDSPARRKVAMRCAVQAISRGMVKDNTNCVIECTGIESKINFALGCLSPFGTLALLGSPRANITLDLYSTVHRKGICIRGAHESLLFHPRISLNKSRPQIIGSFIQKIIEREINAEPLVEVIVTPEEAIKLYTSQYDPQTSKPTFVIAWQR